MSADTEGPRDLILYNDSFGPTVQGTVLYFGFERQHGPRYVRRGQKMAASMHAMCRRCGPTSRPLCIRVDSNLAVATSSIVRMATFYSLSTSNKFQAVASGRFRQGYTDRWRTSDKQNWGRRRLTPQPEPMPLDHDGGLDTPHESFLYRIMDLHGSSCSVLIHRPTSLFA